MSEPRMPPCDRPEPCPKCGHCIECEDCRCRLLPGQEEAEERIRKADDAQNPLVRTLRSALAGANRTIVYLRHETDSMRDYALKECIRANQAEHVYLHAAKEEAVLQTIRADKAEAESSRLRGLIVEYLAVVDSTVSESADEHGMRRYKAEDALRAAAKEGKHV